MGVSFLRQVEMPCMHQHMLIEFDINICDKKQKHAALQPLKMEFFSP